VELSWRCVHDIEEQQLQEQEKSPDQPSAKPATGARGIEDVWNIE
jgi:hypothetical protein